MIEITTPNEEVLEDVSSRIMWDEKDRLECTLVVEDEDLTPELRAEFRLLRCTFDDEKNELT